MNPVVSQDALRDVFAWAPLVFGVVIYLAVWLAKRHETATVPAIGATYSCANCGRRGSREHMVPQVHGGAVSYYCSHCAK
jgi:predicted SprT family Zn-dependent metalloprotease